MSVVCFIWREIKSLVQFLSWLKNRKLYDSSIDDAILGKMGTSMGNFRKHFEFNNAIYKLSLMIVEECSYFMHLS